MLLDSEVQAQAKRYTLYEHDRLDVCVAAKKRMLDVVPELKQMKIKEEQAYDFLLAINQKQTLMAIDCCSVPPMYVHFKETIMTDTGKIKPIDVMWVKAKASAAPARYRTIAQAETEVPDRMIIDQASEANGIARSRSEANGTESVPMEE